jgi:HMG (high mobility group) box
MSAFLSYSNSKRAAVKASNPEIGNAEVSRILAKMWKEAPEEERKLHIAKEFELRQEYKSAIAIWRQNANEELKAARKKREDIALQQVDSPDNSYHHPPPEAAEGSVDIADESTTNPGSPASMVGSAAGPPSAVPAQMQMGAFGMGFNPTSGGGGNGPGCSPQFSPPNYGSFGPPTGMGGAAGMSGGPIDASGMYGMMQPGAFSEGCFPADYGMASHGIGK